jgi:hypothetical protein
MNISLINMYGNRMKYSNCGKEEIMIHNSDQSIDEYINIKNCSICGSFGTGKLCLVK